MGQAYFSGLANICHTAHSIQMGVHCDQNLNNHEYEIQLETEVARLKQLLEESIEALKLHEANAQIYENCIQSQNLQIIELKKQANKCNELSEELNNTLESHNELVDQIKLQNDDLINTKEQRNTEYTNLRDLTIRTAQNNKQLIKSRYEQQDFKMVLALSLKVAFVHLSATKLALEKYADRNVFSVKDLKTEIINQISALNDRANQQGKSNCDEALLYLKDQSTEVYQKTLSHLVV